MPPGTAIALSAGTTTCMLAALLLDVPGLTVVTNSVPVADVIYRSGHTDQTLILTGGVRTPSDALVGPVADRAIATVNLDLLFLGVHGMDPRAGFTTPNLAEAETNRAFVAQAERVVVVADHTKWRTIGLHTIAPLSAAHVVVSDELLEPEAQTALRRHVGRLLIAVSLEAELSHLA